MYARIGLENNMRENDIEITRERMKKRWEKKKNKWDKNKKKERGQECKLGKT